MFANNKPQNMFQNSNNMNTTSNNIWNKNQTSGNNLFQNQNQSNNLFSNQQSQNPSLFPNQNQHNQLFPQNQGQNPNLFPSHGYYGYPYPMPYMPYPPPEYFYGQNKQSSQNKNEYSLYQSGSTLEKQTRSLNPYEDQSDLAPKKSLVEITRSLDEKLQASRETSGLYSSNLDKYKYDRFERDRKGSSLIRSITSHSLIRKKEDSLYQ